MPDDCLFCRFGRGEIPLHEVYRNQRIVAFMDIGPIRPGHVVIIPVDHHDYFESLPEPVAHEIMSLGQRIGRVLKVRQGVERVGFMYSGGDIAHAHAHVVPMVEKTDLTSRRYIQEDDLTFAPLPNPGNEALAAMAGMIREDLSA